MQKKEPLTPNSFMAHFNFGNFFKGCGCVGRDDNEIGPSDSRIPGGVVIQKKAGANFGDNQSAASALDWSDLEELPQIDSDRMRYDDPFGNTNNGQFPYDSYETMEPIDFEALKEVIRDDDITDPEKSVGSGLSKGSKKIGKEHSPSAARASKDSPKNNKKATATAKRGKRNPWQPHEDAKLLELMNKHGQSWTLLASFMEGRTAKQIRDRYIHILRPNIKKGDWTPQEDQHILALYYQYGHKWSKIATLVEGRTEGQVKNRFYSHIKKKLLRDESEPRGSEPHYVMEEYTGKSDSAAHESEISTTAKTLTRSVMETEVNYTKVEHAVYEDPNNLISYPEQEEQYGYNRHGSRENFLLQQKANEELNRLGSNESNPLVRRLISNESDHTVVRRAISGESKKNMSHQGSAEYFEGVPPSPFSSLTNYSNFSKVRNEKDVDVILDRMAMYFNRGSSPQVNQEGEYLEEKELELLKREKNDQLQKRKAALEFLLMKTMEEMTVYNSGTPYGEIPH